MAESATLTIRIPEDTKKQLEAAAQRTDQSVTDFVLHSIRRRMTGACPTCGRDGAAAMVQPPGLGSLFGSWVENLRTQRKVAIATSEPHGNRVYVGRSGPNALHDSYVDMEMNIAGAHYRVKIPRAYIIMWELDDEAEALAKTLVWWGYQDVATVPPAPIVQVGRSGRRS